jgi:uncharacterized membrane protein YdjX (TVP38/TMEM64 family)
VRSLAVLLLLLGALVAARALRERLGLEWSAESIQATVGGFGLWAPLAFALLVMLRQLLALPSVLVLTAAGLLFGATLGAALGGLGIVLNACVLFGSARLMGREWVLPRLRERHPGFEDRARRAGPLFIAVMTGHPMGVMTPFHFAAGATGISWLAFLAAVLPTAPLRAACYSFLGANLLDPGSPRFWLAAALLAAAALLPFAHPAFRRRLLARP